ncbi:addiction module antidote protein [Neorhizobium sp. IRAMC:178]|uniref:addiction module antidote protein n=1 Tax=Neorhizobium tunisiense TaxID=3144793 RepID=UPI0031F6D5EC
MDTEEGIEEFMKAAFEEGDPAFIARCLGTVARARGMTKLARDVGVNRKALFATVLKVMKSSRSRTHAGSRQDGGCRLSVIGIWRITRLPPV